MKGRVRRSNEEMVKPLNTPESVRKRTQTLRARMEDDPALMAKYQAFAPKATAAAHTPEANAKRAKAWTPEMREQARQRQREYQERVRLALAAAGDVKLST